jgi:hypothetical protein
MTMRSLFCLSVLAAAAWGAERGDHVRVILDNSRSMLQTDRPRLAALSTALLFDLANPNLSRADTFEVHAFESKWPLGYWKSGPPPVHTRVPLIPKHAERQAFVQALNQLPYDSWNTYYYPVLKTVIDGLKHTPGGLDDRRVIVLVTDGQPEDPDINLIRQDLLKELQPNHIRMYVLAFGPEAANPKAQDKMRALLSGPGVGDLIFDPTGNDMLENMIKIFSNSFGYTAGVPLTVSGPQPLDLDGGQTPPRVAVVSYWKKPKAPVLSLGPPPKGLVNMAEGLHTAEETGASFSMGWTLSPNRGSYTLGGDSPGSIVAVLRPASLVMSIRPQPPNPQTVLTMANVEFRLRAWVRPGNGAKGDPGNDLEFSYQLHGPRNGDDYEWDLRREGASNPNGESPGDGRFYDIAPIFPPDRRADAREFYEAWLTADVARKSAVLGSMRHRVLVYPFLQLTPTPPRVDAMIQGQMRPIGPGDLACGTFKMSLDGALSHPNRPVYSVQAVIDGKLFGDPRLSRAQFLLDGLALDYAGSPRPKPGEWYTGRRLTRDQLLTKHEVCFQGGRPKTADPGTPAEIPIEFRLMEAPYDSLPAIQPLTLGALIAPPSFSEKYAAALAIALGLLTMLLLAWYTRYRATLSPAMVWSVARHGGIGALTPEALGEGRLLPRLLGLVVERPAYLENGAFTVGWVRPIDGDLYAFRPSRGVSVEGEAWDSSGHRLSVHRCYKARCAERGEYDFWLEYRKP